MPAPDRPYPESHPLTGGSREPGAVPLLRRLERALRASLRGEQLDPADRRLVAAATACWWGALALLGLIGVAVFRGCL